MSWILAAIVLCMGLSAFFSASEIILVTVNQYKLQHLKKEGDVLAGRILEFISRPDWILSAVLVGNNIANVTCTALATLLCTQLTEGREFLASHVPLVTSLALTPLILFFCEILPKDLGRRYANEMIPMIYRPVQLLITLMKPVLVLISKCTNAISSKFGVDTYTHQLKVSREEFVHWMKKSVDSGSVQEETEKMIQSTIEFRETMVKEVMVPLTEIKAISSEKTQVCDLLEFARNSLYTRYPVYKDRIDQIIGYVNIYDILARKLDDHQRIDEFVRSIEYVPNTLAVDKLFYRMQKNRQKIVMAVDEYGGCDGLVTMEDIIEELVGDIAEEHEEFEPLIKKTGSHEYIIDASIDIDELNRELGLGLEKHGFETLAGFLNTSFERIPGEGDSFFINEMYFEILKKENLALTKVKLNLYEDPSS